MAWETPITNWGEAGQTVPGAGDFNRIEGNTADLESRKLDKSGGTMTGVLTAQSNTSYTTKQVRNIILSTADAVLSSMADGDIWIKYGG